MIALWDQGYASKLARIYFESDPSDSENDENWEQRIPDEVTVMPIPEETNKDYQKRRRHKFSKIITEKTFSTDFECPQGLMPDAEVDVRTHQRAVIRRWTETNVVHIEVNRFLRGKKTINVTADDCINYTACLLKSLPEQAGIVGPKSKDDCSFNWLCRGYHSCTFMDLFKECCIDDIGDVVDMEHTVGKELLFKSFLATSNRQDVGITFMHMAEQAGITGGQFMLRFKNASGYQIHRIAIDENESEVLLPPGTRARVIGVRQGHINVIDLEVAADGIGL